MLLLYMFIMPHLVWGPRAPFFADQHKCKNYWWTTLLFINNIYPAMNETCMAWTWYLSNDMQYFVISPVFIYAFCRNSLVALGLLSLFLSICMGATVLLVACVNYTLPVWIAGRKPVTDLIYRAPFVRISPYLVGLVAGFVLFKIKASKPTLPRTAFFLGWLLASGVTMTILFGTNVQKPMGIVGSVLFETFSHFSWGICLTWVVTACEFGGPG
ncbi:Nose resistant to fluoxetine protein 6 [Holothuria leucospilota]|uniref:Nose resistant to fluoxetine protein 6 n=1 Tax=Holothuria leucospilota TaxID=206669 RepID=A0A9Q1BRW2_HOLLE|nr:Nose resistant to fluoxetine protein 6 [Holothuria leucospilota]